MVVSASSKFVPPSTETSFSTSMLGHATLVVAVADRSRASDWVVVVEAVAVFERLAQPVTVPVTVIVTEALAASVPRLHGNVLDVSQAKAPPGVARCRRR